MTTDDTVDPFLASLFRELGQGPSSSAAPSTDAPPSLTTSRRSALMRLSNAWVNERNAPELLGYETEVVEKIRGDIERHEELIEGELEGTDPEERFFVTLHQADVERTRFVLRSYLRTRISKLERCPQYYLSSPDRFDGLPPHEKRYLESYWGGKAKLFSTTILEGLPTSLHKLDVGREGPFGSMVAEPNMKAAVFIRTLEDVGPWQLSTGESVLMEKGNQFLFRWVDAKGLLEEGRVRLL